MEGSRKKQNRVICSCCSFAIPDCDQNLNYIRGWFFWALVVSAASLEKQFISF